ncbi:MAG: CDP-glucose 4,6-dehydratase [Deltaproteobacteria bacterium]|nr:CDP-glucose 4,6-dehydratase [Deltaproteobacteria bacterium]
MENMAVNFQFWRRRPVFLTGHTGFKGGWLSLWLQRLGAEVTGFALSPPTNPNLYTEARVGEGMRTVEGDVRDPDRLSQCLGESQAEIAFHLAAQPLVGLSYLNPVLTYATNVMGTVHFLEAVRQTPSVKAAVVITSDKCYENREWSWGYREDDPMGGHDPYSSSKGCAELVTSAYRRSFFDGNRTNLASVRAGNIIGGGDWAENRLVPDMVRAFSAGTPLEVRRPEAVRPWQHVLEPLHGYLLLAEQLWNDSSLSRGWNFGPQDDDARPVLELVRLAAGFWGPDAAWLTKDSVQFHEAHYLKLDCSLARQKLGWKPRLNLETAMDWTMAWYRAHLNGSPDMKSFTERQIERYMSLPG